MNCPECGAPEVACVIRFHECLVKEFEDAAYGAVHHLTVAAYMLQHSSRLTREGWLRERELLTEFLAEKKSPAYIRRQNKDLVDSGKRYFNIKSKDGKPVISKTTWTKTILDVRMEQAEAYCEDMTACSMLPTMQPTTGRKSWRYSITIFTWRQLNKICFFT